MNNLLAIYRARWLLLRAQIHRHWAPLTLREKRLVAGTALMLGGVLIWLLFVQPPLKKIQHWQTETPKLRGQAEALDLLLREVATGPIGQNVERSLQQSLDGSGLLGHYQLQAIGTAWLLTFEDAPADAAISWLLIHPVQFSLEVVEARLQRADAAKVDDTAGTLSGTVRMDQALGAKEAS
jgi:general secretion pathway protein M